MPAGHAVGPGAARARPRRAGRPRAATAKPGDLMVKIEVLVPTELTEEQRAAVESLAAVTEAAPRQAVES